MFRSGVVEAEVLKDVEGRKKVEEDDVEEE
jgi:hypothetical protein